MKIVVNRCFGGFGLSYEAVMLYAKLNGINLYGYINDYSDKTYTTFLPYKEEGRKSCIHYSTLSILPNGKLDDESYFSVYNIKRTDPILIEVVETLGEKANGEHAKLEIVEIPDGIEWHIDEYDGIESVHENHRSW